MSARTDACELAIGAWIAKAAAARTSTTTAEHGQPQPLVLRPRRDEGLDLEVKARTLPPTLGSARGGAGALAKPPAMAGQAGEAADMVSGVGAAARCSKVYIRRDSKKKGRHGEEREGGKGLTCWGSGSPVLQITGALREAPSLGKMLVRLPGRCSQSHGRQGRYGCVCHGCARRGVLLRAVERWMGGAPVRPPAWSVRRRR